MYVSVATEPSYNDCFWPIFDYWLIFLNGICLYYHQNTSDYKTFDYYNPDRGGWELIDSHGACTVVCPSTPGRIIGTETSEMGNVFPPDDL